MTITFSGKPAAKPAQADGEIGTAVIGGLPFDASTGLPVIGDTVPIALLTTCQFMRPKTMAAMANDILTDADNLSDPLAFMIIRTIQEALITYFDGFERQTFKDCLSPKSWAEGWTRTPTF